MQHCSTAAQPRGAFSPQSNLNLNAQSKSGAIETGHTTSYHRAPKLVARTKPNQARGQCHSLFLPLGLSVCLSVSFVLALALTLALTLMHGLCRYDLFFFSSSRVGLEIEVKVYIRPYILAYRMV